MSSEDSSQRIAEHLTSLADIGEQTGMHSIAREIRDERLPALEQGRLSVVVLGEFNHGKSTAINALLGRDVLPTGITPTTSVITHIVHGDGTPRVVRDDDVDEVEVDALAGYLTDDAPDDLRYVEVPIESPFLEGGVFVVDTPGVNDISKQKVEITYGYVPRADVILYVLDATQALKQSEIAFIESRLIRNSHDRLFFLLGKVDALSDDEVTEVIDHVRRRLARMVGDVPIFPASARRALTGEDPGFEAFKTAISGYVKDQRDAIVVDGAVRTGLRLSSVLDQNLAIEQGALALEDEELEKRVASVKDRLHQSRRMVSENIAIIDRKAAEIAAATRENVRTFARDFSTALPREVERASADDIKRYLPDFIHDTFKDWLEAEGTHVAMKLELLAEEIITITNRNMRDVLEEVHEELGVRGAGIDLDVDTFGYDVGVFALGALGVTFIAFNAMLVGGLLTAAAPVLAFVLRDRVDAMIRDKATEQGLAAIETAAEKIEAELDEVVEDFAIRLKQFVEDAGDRLYRQIAEALDRVVDERKKHTGDRAPIAAELEDVRAKVATIREDLAQMRDAQAAAEGA